MFSPHHVTIPHAYHTHRRRTPRVWEDVGRCIYIAREEAQQRRAPTLLRIAEENLRCSDTMPNSLRLHLPRSLLHPVVFILLYILESSFFLFLFYFSLFVSTVESLLSSDAFSLYPFPFFFFHLSCSLLYVTCNIRLLHAHTSHTLSRSFAGTKTDRTVSIAPVSIRFRRVQSNKRQNDQSFVP